MMNEHIGLHEVENGKFACDKCEGLEFEFTGSVNLEDCHHTHYKCINCNVDVVVISPKTESDYGFKI